MVKKITLLTLILITSLSCNKEVGKKTYYLIFNFDSGNELKLECRILEKQKVYNTEYGNHTVSLKNSEDKIVIIPVYNTYSYYQITLLKGEGNHLLGLSNQSFKVNDQFINGPLEMYGDYDKKGRKFIVENGTFTIDWTNAADYGQSIQQLKGTWSLKRK